MIKKYKILQNKLEGSIYTIFTAFSKNSKIDYKSIEKYIDFLYQKKAKVFYVMPYNSRYSQLREKEIFELNKFCIQKVKSLNNTIIIVSDSIHGPTDLKKEYCYDAKKFGADIFSSICREKYFSDEQIFNHYKEMNDCNMPILVHVMPFLSGYDVKNMNWPDTIFKRLTGLKNIIAIKEDTKELNYSISLLKKYQPRFRFIFAGRKKYFLKLFKYGLKAYLNSSSLIDPRIDEIFLSLCKKNLVEAKNFVTDIDDPFWDTIVNQYGWHRVNKACLEHIGMMKRIERHPMVSLNNKNYKDIQNWVKSTLKKIKKWQQ